MAPTLTYAAVALGAALALAAIMLVLGGLWMRKIVSFKF